MTEGWKPSAAVLAWASRQGIAAPLTALDEFRDHWLGVAGSTGAKLDWDAAYRNRLRLLVEQGRLDVLGPEPAAEQGVLSEKVREITNEERARISERAARLADRLRDRMVVR